MNDGHGHFTDETATRMPEQVHSAKWPQRLLVEDVNDDGRPDLTVEFANAGDQPKDDTAVDLNRDGVFRRIAGPADGPDPAVGGPVGYVNGDGPHALLSVEFRTLEQAPSSYYVTPQFMTPTPPLHLRAVRLRASIRVTWSPVAQASRYQARRNGTQIATTSSTSFLDRNPPQHPIYAIRTTNPAGTSADSEWVRPRP
jgi:hypothetical protein